MHWERRMCLIYHFIIDIRQWNEINWKERRNKNCAHIFQLAIFFRIIIYARFLSLAHFLIMPLDRLITLAFFASVQNAKAFVCRAYGHGHGHSKSSPEKQTYWHRKWYKRLTLLDIFHIDTENLRLFVFMADGSWLFVSSGDSCTHIEHRTKFHKLRFAVVSLQHYTKTTSFRERERKSRTSRRLK